MSEFEDKSQAELHAMVSDANPQDFYDRAATLYDAATHMDQLSQELQKHVNSVEWQGSGGDAFRQWGQQLVNTTSDFSTYTNTVSTSLYSVGDSLTTAVAGVRAPLTSPTVPLPGAQPYINGALPLADSLQRDESINLMNSLSSSYSTATTDFKAQPPVFAPMPQAMMPDSALYGQPQTGVGPGGGQTGGAPARPGANEPEQHSAVRPAPGSEPSHPVTMPGAPKLPDRHTKLDSLPPGPGATPPSAPTVPGGPSGGTGPGGPGRGGLTPVGGLPPYGTGPGGAGGEGEFPAPGTPGSRLPGAGSAGCPDDDGIVGGATGGFGGGSRGLVVGDEEPPLSRIPGGLGAAGPSGGYGRYSDGPYRSSGLARGIGDDEEEFPGSAAGGNGSGAIGGSGTAEEESGAMRPGMGAAFGGVGPGAGRRARSSGSRPDYVVEDEETWMTGGGTVPPVID